MAVVEAAVTTGVCMIVVMRVMMVVVVVMIVMRIVIVPSPIRIIAPVIARI